MCKTKNYVYSYCIFKLVAKMLNTKYAYRHGIKHYFMKIHITFHCRWDNTVVAVGAKGTNPKPEHPFVHPYVRTLSMFAAEASCLIVFKLLYYYHKKVKKTDLVTRFGKQDFSIFVFLFPAICDMLATSTLYIGLQLTYTSSYQVLQGARLIFTAFLSVAFLGSKVPIYYWTGVISVVIGLAVVSLGDMVSDDSNSADFDSLITGNILIVASQAINSIQFVMEQKLLQGYNIPPLQAVGWEGVFGFCILGVAVVPMYLIPWHLPAGPDFWQDHARFEDIVDAVNQLLYIPSLAIAFVSVNISIAFFNFASLSVTKLEDAITRTVIDSLRAVILWIIGLAFKWQYFEYFQPVGYSIVVIGMCVFCNIIFSWVMKKLGIWPACCGNSYDDDDDELVQH
ncbi:solute carrier family 35 member F6-like isoform X2 [Dysidea avara]|uniref:solute carrier family 35 member F6-like isoform X2 n=1 Tax=Dysidea avara TaxID=196820 RepID=UPI0033245239